MSTDIVKKLDESMQVGVEASKMQGFAKAIKLGEAVEDLKELLTDEAMQPIMKLQGKRLGFRTDKDDKGGYPIQVVRECLIEAVLMGLQPVGNQFNIIAGGPYVTQEGFGFLLKQLPKFKWELTPKLPQVNKEKTGASVPVEIKWQFEGGPEEIREISFYTRMNAYSSLDALTGKAKRKARKWLYDHVTGNDTPEGDVTDIAYEEVKNDDKQAKIDPAGAKATQLNLESKEDGATE